MENVEEPIMWRAIMWEAMKKSSVTICLCMFFWPASADTGIQLTGLVKLDDYLNEIRASFERMDNDVDTKSVTFTISPINVEIHTTATIGSDGKVELYVVSLGADVAVSATSKMAFSITPSINIVDNQQNSPVNHAGVPGPIYQLPSPGWTASTGEPMVPFVAPTGPVLTEGKLPTYFDPTTGQQYGLYSIRPQSNSMTSIIASDEETQDYIQRLIDDAIIRALEDRSQ